MSKASGEVTLLLRKMRDGAGDASARLAELVYDQLRRIATAKMRRERLNHTLTPTALANEAWLRLQDYDHDIEDRNHFFAIAAGAMRRLLIDYARARTTGKRNESISISIEAIPIAALQADEQLLAVNDALDRLMEVNARAGKVVELRYFAGLTHDRIASVLGVERRTVDRDWAFARAWLFTQIAEKP